MQTILLFLAVSAMIGVRGFREEDRPLPIRLLLAMSVLLAMAMYSRRIG